MEDPIVVALFLFLVIVQGFILYKIRDWVKISEGLKKTVTEIHHEQDNCSKLGAELQHGFVTHNKTLHKIQTRITKLETEGISTSDVQVPEAKVNDTDIDWDEALEHYKKNLKDCPPPPTFMEPKIEDIKNEETE